MMKYYECDKGNFKTRLIHSGDFWTKFRRHRWVANDRSDQDEAIDVLYAQVGPVGEAGDHVQAGVLRLNLAIWSDVTSVIMRSLSQLAWPAWCVCVHALQRDWVRGLVS